MGHGPAERVTTGGRAAARGRPRPQRSLEPPGCRPLHQMHEWSPSMPSGCRNLASGARTVTDPARRRRFLAPDACARHRGPAVATIRASSATADLWRAHSWSERPGAPLVRRSASAGPRAPHVLRSRRWFAAAWSSSWPTVGVALPNGRRRVRRSAATRRSRKMIVWPVRSSSRITANSSAALIQDGQSHTTLSGVRTMKTTRTIELEPEAAEPGPRSGSRSSPLYWTGPVGRGRRGGVGSAFGSTGSAGASAAFGSTGWAGPPGRRHVRVTGSPARSAAGLGSVVSVGSVTKRNDTGCGLSPPGARPDRSPGPSTTSTPGRARRARPGRG